MTRLELKRKAKEQIGDNILILFLCNLIFYCITGAFQFFYGLIRTYTSLMNGTIQNGIFIPAAPIISPVMQMLSFTTSILTLLITPALTLGMTKIYINLTKNIRPTVPRMFDGFYSFGKALWLNIITGFFTLLWALLFIIPAFIKALSYSMGFYILAENPNMTAREALDESKRIMRGHKMDLLILHLSFIWWYLLCLITFGIASIYVAPYVSSAIANFYNKIKFNDTTPGETVPVYEVEP